jgi:hypothetical protein
MNPQALGPIFTHFNPPVKTVKDLKINWTTKDKEGLAACEKVFKDLSPQHEAAGVSDFVKSVASSSSFRTSSKGQSFSSVGACLADITSNRSMKIFKQQYNYTAIRKIRYVLSFIIPLYANTHFPDSPKRMGIWKFWDRLDIKVGLERGIEVGDTEQAKVVQKVMAEIPEQKQQLQDLYTLLSHHPALSFQPPQKGKRIPDPVLGNAIYDLIEVSISTALSMLWLRRLNR